MKVTAYIQFSDDPKKNLIDFDAIKINVAGKLGLITITSTLPIDGLPEDAPDETGHPTYSIALEDIVDFVAKDSLPSDKKKGLLPAPKTKVPATAPVKKERKPYTRKAPTKKVTKPVKEAPSKKVVPTEKIKAETVELPVKDVLRNLTQKGIVSSRASGTIAAVAEKLGLLEDWHSFLGLVTKTEWAKQENVGKTIMDLIPVLYKKSGVELKD